MLVHGGRTYLDDALVAGDEVAAGERVEAREVLAGVAETGVAARDRAVALVPLHQRAADARRRHAARKQPAAVRRILHVRPPGPFDSVQTWTLGAQLTIR